MWIRTYGTIAPLEEEDILASKPIHGNIPAKFPEITTAKKTLSPFPPYNEQAAGWSIYSDNPIMTAMGSFGGSNQSTTTTSCLTSSQPHRSDLSMTDHACLSEPSCQPTSAQATQLPHIQQQPPRPQARNHTRAVHSTSPLVCDGRCTTDPSRCDPTRGAGGPTGEQPLLRLRGHLLRVAVRTQAHDRCGTSR